MLNMIWFLMVQGLPSTHVIEWSVNRPNEQGLVQSSLKPCWIMRHRVVLVNTTVQHLRKIELRSRTGSNYAHGLSEIRDGENFWPCYRLKIRLNVFVQSTIQQKAIHRYAIFLSFEQVASKTWWTFYEKLATRFKSELHLQIWWISSVGVQ